MLQFKCTLFEVLSYILYLAIISENRMRGDDGNQTRGYPLEESVPLICHPHETDFLYIEHQILHATLYLNRLVFNLIVESLIRMTCRVRCSIFVLTTRWGCLFYIFIRSPADYFHFVFAIF